jgi:hypothetical protein
VKFLRPEPWVAKKWQDDREIFLDRLRTSWQKAKSNAGSGGAWYIEGDNPLMV